MYVTCVSRCTKYKLLYIYIYTLIYGNPISNVPNRGGRILFTGYSEFRLPPLFPIFPAPSIKVMQLTRTNVEGLRRPRIRENVYQYIYIYIIWQPVYYEHLRMSLV